VLVIGVEKLTKFGGGTLPLDEDDWEVHLGLSMPALYAMRAQRYMHDYGIKPEQVAGVRSRTARAAPSIPTHKCAKR
jgi:benzoylsuccinyl-CoA thiolase BbsB subunit